jgi:hypothetical protein
VTHLLPRLTWSRLAYGAGGVVAADLVTGMAAFSSIALGSLWMFSVGWIILQSEYAAHGMAFGTPAQLTLAWFGAFVAIPTMVGVIWLAFRAYGIARSLLAGRSPLVAGA